MSNIVDGVRGYESAGARRSAITQLRKRGFNYFICFCEKTSAFALAFSRCDWVTKERGPQGAYIDW